MNEQMKGRNKLDLDFTREQHGPIRSKGELQPSQSNQARAETEKGSTMSKKGKWRER